MGALDGKIAIVTGGTSGIGEGIAKAFVSEGAKVVIVGRREEEGRALEKQIGVRFVRADVANEADVKVDGRTNPRMVRPPRLPRQQRRNSLADDQHHRDRRGDHRSGSGRQRPRRHSRGQARRARHARAGSPAASSTSAAWPGIRGGLSGPYLLRAKGRRQRADALRRRGARRKGNSRQLHLARRHRHRYLRQERGARGREGGPGGRASSRRLFARSSRSREPACRTISRKRRCSSRATPPDSSTGRTSSSTAGKRP